MKESLASTLIVCLPTSTEKKESLKVSKADEKFTKLNKKRRNRSIIGSYCDYSNNLSMAKVLTKRLLLIRLFGSISMGIWLLLSMESWSISRTPHHPKGNSFSVKCLNNSDRWALLLSWVVSSHNDNVMHKNSALALTSPCEMKIIKKIYWRWSILSVKDPTESIR